MHFLLLYSNNRWDIIIVPSVSLSNCYGPLDTGASELVITIVATAGIGKDVKSLFTSCTLYVCVPASIWKVCDVLVDVVDVLVVAGCPGTSGIAPST